MYRPHHSDRRPPATAKDGFGNAVFTVADWPADVAPDAATRHVRLDDVARAEVASA